MMAWNAIIRSVISFELTCLSFQAGPLTIRLSQRVLHTPSFRVIELNVMLVEQQAKRAIYCFSIQANYGGEFGYCSLSIDSGIEFACLFIRNGGGKRKRISCTHHPLVGHTMRNERRERRGSARLRRGQRGQDNRTERWRKTFPYASHKLLCCKGLGQIEVRSLTQPINPIKRFIFGTDENNIHGSSNCHLLKRTAKGIAADIRQQHIQDQAHGLEVRHLRKTRSPRVGNFHIVSCLLEGSGNKATGRRTIIDDQNARATSHQFSLLYTPEVVMPGVVDSKLMSGAKARGNSMRYLPVPVTRTCNSSVPLGIR